MLVAYQNQQLLELCLKSKYVQWFTSPGIVLRAILRKLNNNRVAYNKKRVYAKYFSLSWNAILKQGVEWERKWHNG